MFIISNVRKCIDMQAESHVSSADCEFANTTRLLIVAKNTELLFGDFISILYHFSRTRKIWSINTLRHLSCLCWSVLLLFRLQSKSSIRSLLIKLNDKVFKFKKVTCFCISKVELYVPLTKLINL